MKHVNLSVSLAVYNEEKNLDACLSSVKDIADEIVVIDGGSTDATVSIATRYGATIISTDNPSMFHLNKQKALDASHGEWILQLDADEVVTPELKEEIRQVIGLRSSGLEKLNTSVFLKPKTKTHTPHLNGYFIPRKNFFWGRFMTKGGTFPDAVIRLVRKGHAHFPCQSVHEQITIDGDIGHLHEPMLHYSYPTRRDYWRKAEIYTTLTAQQLSRIQNSKLHMPGFIGWRIKTFIDYCLIKPIVTFITLYVRHKGFMDGLQGFEFALYSSMHFPIAYNKINR